MVKRILIAGFAAGGVIVGLVGCAGIAQDVSRSAGDTTVKTVVSPETVTCALVAPSPEWVPAQATMDSVSCAGTPSGQLAHGPRQASELRNAPDQLVSRAPGQTVRTIHYSLSGAANASTITPGGGQGHFGTDIQLVTYVGATELDASLEDQYTRVTAVTLSSGGTARVTTMANGYGSVRIEWVAGGNSYLLLSDHLVTADGESGVPTGDLITIAGSVPAG